jgi:branched-chain amino acid transport system ATP-binding protein
MLVIEQINVFYENIQAIHNVSFSVGKGEIVSLIGANGAGKSTILKTISGVLKPRSGKILLEGRDLVGVPPHSIVRMGISQVPEGRGIFANMNVRENLEMGAFIRNSREEMAKGVGDVFALFPRLKERASQPAGTLSGGEQQMLAIGRAMVARPALVLMDEPSMGLSPLLVFGRFSGSSGKSTRPGRPSCSSSRTPSWRFPSLTARTFWKPGRSPCRETHPSFATIRRFARPISAT